MNISNRRALAVVLVLVIGIAFIWLKNSGLPQLLQSDPRNLASEIELVDGAGDSQVRVMTASGSPVELIPGLTMTIESASWRASRQSARGEISPSDPAHRFLYIWYQISNGVDQTFSVDGFADLFKIVDGTRVVSEGRILGFEDGVDFGLFNPKISKEAIRQIAALENYRGVLYFELDSRIPDLQLESELARVVFNLPVDENHPLSN